MMDMISKVRTGLENNCYMGNVKLYVLREMSGISNFAEWDRYW